MKRREAGEIARLVETSQKTNDGKETGGCCLPHPSSLIWRAEFDVVVRWPFSPLFVSSTCLHASSPICLAPSLAAPLIWLRFRCGHVSKILTDVFHNAKKICSPVEQEKAWS